MIIPPIRLPSEALDRTMRLMRDHVGPAISDDDLVAGLTSCRVAIVADSGNASSRQGQIAMVTAALLCARSGARVHVAAPNTELLGTHAPLRGARLLDALTEIGSDLIPGSPILEGVDGREDVTILVGDSNAVTAPRGQVIRLTGDDWTGSIRTENHLATSWTKPTGPFGAMASGALAAGEAYKGVMRRFREFSRVPLGVFDQTFAASRDASVALAPAGTQVVASLGNLDFISGGAITHAALYALSRINGAVAAARVVEPQSYDNSNLNRYQLMRWSDVGSGKARHLAAIDLGGVAIVGIAANYDATSADSIGRLAESVLVGADHIPTRWFAQINSPSWLSVAGSEHYQTATSFHELGTACAACLHHFDAGVDPRAPTVAFVSFWAGLWLAALLVRSRAGKNMVSEQVVMTTMLRPDWPYAVARGPVQFRADCRLRCAPAASHRAG